MPTTTAQPATPADTAPTDLPALQAEHATLTAELATYPRFSSGEVQIRASRLQLRLWDLTRDIKAIELAQVEARQTAHDECRPALQAAFDAIDVEWRAMQAKYAAALGDLTDHKDRSQDLRRHLGHLKREHAQALYAVDDWPRRIEEMIATHDEATMRAAAMQAAGERLKRASEPRLRRRPR